MAFNYSKLRGKVTEVCGTCGAFSDKLGISSQSLSMKLQGRSDWKQEEIIKACEILGISHTDIPAYFFSL